MSIHSPASPASATLDSAPPERREAKPFPSPDADRSLPRPGDPGVLFFGGHRRSGTTWLCSMLNSHPELHVRNEGWLMNDRGTSFDQWFNREKFEAWATSREGHGTWMRDLDVDATAALLQRTMLTTLLKEATLRETWKQFDQLRWIGDKTTMFYAAGAETLHRLFPAPRGRFLTMLRDGRDTAVSDLFLLFREQRFHDLPPDCSEHAIRSYQFHIKGQGPRVPLFSPALLRHIVLHWVDSVYQSRRAAELYGTAFLEVRYEDLVRDTPAHLARVYRWLGVDASPDRIANIVHDNRFERASGGRPRGQEDPLAEWRKGVVGDWQDRFTPEDKDMFKAIAGSLLIELGYADDTKW